MARDAQDEADFVDVLAGSERLAKVLADGSRLLPDFEALLLDLFSAFVKLNVKLTDGVRARGQAGGLPASAVLRLAVLRELTRSEAFEETRRVTVLRPVPAGYAALSVAREVLERLRRREILTPAELESLWRLVAVEEAALEARERVRSARELAGEHEQARGVLDAVRRELEEEAGDLEAEARALGELAAAAVDGVPRETWSALVDRAGDTGGVITQAEASGAARAGQGGAPSGSGDGVDALALQAQLAAMPGVKRLVALLGALREEARAAQRKRVPKARTEVFGVELGRDLMRLLPIELASLRHPALRLDFKRRFAESALLSYHLRGEEELGRGPAVFLLDVSGSMSGAKVVWAKAVVLTLADLARRAQRRVAVICFASGDRRERFDLAVPRRGQPVLGFDPVGLMGLAQLGVGGGTDFEGPLRDAMEMIAAERVFRRADVVIVTDGEAQLSGQQVESVRGFAKSHETRFLGVLVDVAEHASATLERVCDEVVRVRELTVETARTLFKRF